MGAVDTWIFWLQVQVPIGIACGSVLNLFDRNSSHQSPPYFYWFQVQVSPCFTMFHPKTNQSHNFRGNNYCHLFFCNVFGIFEPWRYLRLPNWFGVGYPKGMHLTSLIRRILSAFWDYPPVNKRNYGKSSFLMGKSNISRAFSIAMLNYQRVASCRKSLLRPHSWGSSMFHTSATICHDSPRKKRLVTLQHVQLHWPTIAPSNWSPLNCSRNYSRDDS